MADLGIFNMGFRISEGVRSDQTTVLTLIVWIDRSKQTVQTQNRHHRIQNVVSDQGLQFVTHSAILDTFTFCNMDLCY